MTKHNNKSTHSKLAITPQQVELAGEHVSPLQYFRVAERHPNGDGPWSDEADKIGWIDKATGLHCIILRELDGTLSGFVAVGSDHVLSGFNADAVPYEVGISVHGGLNYASACEANVPEKISVCHVSDDADQERSDAGQYRGHTENKFDGDELWWFGFSTNHHGDLIPIPPSSHCFEGIETYRDQDFVYGEVIRMASQLDQVSRSKAKMGGIITEGLLLLDYDDQGGATNE